MSSYCEPEDVLDLRVEPEARQRPWRPAQLLFRLLEVVGVEMRVPERMDELARLEPGDLRHHLGQQRIGRDVERHAEEDVAAALVELAAQPALRRRRTGTGSGTAAAPCRRPRPGSTPSRYAAAIPAWSGSSARRRRSGRSSRPSRPARAPLAAVDRPEVAVRVGPLVPDLDPALLQPAHIGLAAEEPQQLVDHRLEMELLGRQQRKALRRDRTASGSRTPSASPSPSGRPGRFRCPSHGEGGRDTGAWAPAVTGESDRRSLAARERRTKAPHGYCSVSRNRRSVRTPRGTACPVAGTADFGQRESMNRCLGTRVTETVLDWLPPSTW